VEAQTQVKTIMSTATTDHAEETLDRPGQVLALAVPAQVRLRVSDEDFWRLCLENPDLRLERNAQGELIVMPPAAPDGSQRNMSLSAQLWNWNQRTKLGVVFDSSAGFTLPNSAIRGPDASWMTAERWARIPSEERLKFSHVCPDVIAELRSKSDTMKDLREKMEEYLTQGARLGWLIDPIGGTVEIYRPGRPVEILQRPATLSGEDVLPGFVLDLKGILFH
jgi:Uma2 family endonuclease